MGTFGLRTEVGEGGLPVIYVSGDLDTQSAPLLRKALWDLLLNGSQVILLQIDGVEYVDSSGLGILVAALRYANEISGTVAIACPKPRVSRVLRITGLDKIFSVYADEQEARRALATCEQV
ncbi:MAG TPA: STAS domain-containing protein [Capsulimonadaceae bacterium]|jgi:anti-sigma B factor antagonist